MTSSLKPTGILIPIGGNEDKGLDTPETYARDFITEGILSKVVNESGGPDARIVIIPTASGIPVEVGENYLSAFGKLGCTNLKVLDIRSREQSESANYIKSIKEADCVMFSGGDQSKIVDKIGGTSIHKILEDRYHNDSIVIAGTSAGAMSMSSEMIAGGDSTESFYKDAVLMRDGMGFIPEVIIDSHFIKRGRFGRLSGAMAKFPDLLGVGLAEDTGVIIRNGNNFEVIGSGMVIVFDPSNLKHNNEKVLDSGTPMTLTNLTVHILAAGDQFEPKQRMIKILPIDAKLP